MERRRSRWGSVVLVIKVLCPHCERLSELEQFRVEAGVLHVACLRCGQESQAAASASPQVVSTRAAGESQSAPRSNEGYVPTLSPLPMPAPQRMSLSSAQGASNVVMLRTAGLEAIEKASRAADSDAFTLPAGFCPKCVAKRGAAPFCPQCGVSFDTFEEANVVPPPWLKEAWIDLLRDWGNETRHETLRQRARQADSLTDLGRLYRLRLAAEPLDPIAENGRAEVLRMASVPIAFRPAAEEPKTHWLKVVFALLVIGGCIAAAAALITSLGPHR